MPVGSPRRYRVSARMLYNIFKRESIGIDLLFRISEVLGHDFFKEISDEIVREMSAGNGK